MLQIEQLSDEEDYDSMQETDSNVDDFIKVLNQEIQSEDKQDQSDSFEVFYSDNENNENQIEQQQEPNQYASQNQLQSNENQKSEEQEEVQQDVEEELQELEKERQKMLQDYQQIELRLKSISTRMNQLQLRQENNLKKAMILQKGKSLISVNETQVNLEGLGQNQKQARKILIDKKVNSQKKQVDMNKKVERIAFQMRYVRFTNEFENESDLLKKLALKSKRKRQKSEKNLDKSESELGKEKTKTKKIKIENAQSKL